MTENIKFIDCKL